MISIDVNEVTKSVKVKIAAMHKWNWVQCLEGMEKYAHAHKSLVKDIPY